MLACAEECPEVMEETDVATAHILDVTKHLTEHSQEHLWPRGKLGVSMHMLEYPTGTDELLGATAAPSDHRVHTYHLDPVYDSGPSGYSLTEPDVGLLSVDTPIHNGISSVRSVSQVTTRTATCTTATVTVGRTLMSIYPYTSGQTILLNDRSDRSKPLRSIIDREANLRSIIRRFFMIIKWMGLLL